MAQQTPILCISSSGVSPALSALNAFPVVDTPWSGVAKALETMRPAAVLVFDADQNQLSLLQAQVTAIEPYVPLIVVNPLPSHALMTGLPFTALRGNLGRLQTRLNASLRVRALHATVLRRAADLGVSPAVPSGDPLHDACVLLLGRGASYPVLSVALGERVAVVGALGIEAAARHLAVREINGIIIGDGFSPRVVDAFATVLSEDARFRVLPVIAVGATAASIRSAALPNFEAAQMPAADAAAYALSLIRQHAFATKLSRVLQSLDAGGALDARTGLLTPTAFDRNLQATIVDALRQGAGLSIVRVDFDLAHDGIRRDAARTISHLLRKTDFATLGVDGAILVVLTDTELKTAHSIARRIASVLKHTPHGAGRDKRIDPTVKIAALLPQDTAETLRARVMPQDQRAAS
jgi:GGDEF domain-containing protein